MTKAEDDGVHYDYNEFLNDSSDDEKFVIKQADDDMNYQEAYSPKQSGQCNNPIDTNIALTKSDTDYIWGLDI